MIKILSRITRGRLFYVAAFLALGPLSAEPLNHRLYLMAGLTQDFTIGKQVASKSGLYLIKGRETAEHLGFHHPRLDKGDFDPRDPAILYIAGLNGLLRTPDGGKSWRIMTSWDMTEGKDVKLDPFYPDRVYLALPDGIGISTDQGMNWKYADLPTVRRYTQTLAPDQYREGILLAGTELGIYRSTDHGDSWKQVLETAATVQHISQSPHNPDHYLAATQADGVLISRDGGFTWEEILSHQEGSSFHFARFDPHNSEVLTASGWGVGLMVSNDGGDEWESVQGLSGLNVWSHSHDPDFPNRMYACLYRDTIYVSDDWAQSGEPTWEPFIFPGATVWDYLFVPQQSE